MCESVAAATLPLSEREKKSTISENRFVFRGKKCFFSPQIDIVERGRDIVERDKLYLRLSPFFYSAENKLTWERHFLC
jgi:hypothetical protein